MTSSVITQLSFPSLQNAPRAKPFLKWAGGKAQLLPQFRELYPRELKSGKLTTYVEPFLGGGAVFFDIVQAYPIANAFLYDINPELILIYKVVQRRVEDLIESLEAYSKQYYGLDDEQRKTFYYQVRENLNAQKSQIDFERFSDAWVERAAMLLFLNRTCFNGLFRLNSRGEFNVPFGQYKKPRILDAENLSNASGILQIAEIRRGDFEDSFDVIDRETFVYFDPPYRPISKTSSFTSYSKYSFGDEEQRRLATYFARLHKEKGAKMMLSNSDPTNVTADDTFFEDLYQGFHIYTVYAQRAINSKGSKRGPIRELVITNYEVAI